jgi:HPt (histidine-containing phosphotransfer) domain-containing protein
MYDQTIVLSQSDIRSYINRRVDDLQACKKASQREDWNAIELIGHRLRGSAASFGFPELGDLGTFLEKSAQKHAASDILQGIQAFNTWVNDHVLGNT